MGKSSATFFRNSADPLLPADNSSPAQSVISRQ
jgi:hypothetical protein